MIATDDSTCLQAGDALLIFSTDQVAEEIRHLFRREENPVS
jgi:hypothetical protein